MSDPIPTLRGTTADPTTTANRKWFEEQRLKSIDSLDASARNLITLSTTLLGILFGLLSLGSATLPAQTKWSGIQWLGAGCAVALFAVIALGLQVVWPREYHANPSAPTEVQSVIDQLLATKSRWLKAAGVAFLVGMGQLVGLILATLALAV